MDELNELRCVKYDLVEEGYIELLESWGIDAGHEVLEVFGGPFEHKICENRKDSAGQGRRASVFLVRERLRGFEFNGKIFEAGQCGEGSGHRLG
jgi:hypothetical protein